MNSALLEGVVVQKSSRYVQVAIGRASLRCSVRGKFRRTGSNQLPVVVGDRVRVREVSSGEGILEERLPRRTELRRCRAGGPCESPDGAAKRLQRRDRVVAANVDQVLAVVAACRPPPRWALVDRILVSACYEDLDAGICLNKWDQVEGQRGPAGVLDDRQEREERLARHLEDTLRVYRQLEYPVFRTSALHAEGLDELTTWLRSKTTVLSGHSGVGKSTLLNALSSGVNAATGTVSDVTGKGRHVTAAVSLWELDCGGFLVDTPGYREYGLGGLEPAQIGSLYREFQPHLGSCRFKNCLHLDEPHCAVQRARREGKIDDLRYANYCQIVGSLRAGPPPGRHAPPDLS